MINFNRKLSLLRTFAFALLTVFGLTTLAIADHKQKHKQGKKNDVFVNGHDARDGRWDGRGPRRDRDRDRDDDDRNSRRNRRDQDRDRDNDGIRDRQEIRNQAFNIGYDEGFKAGQDDRSRNRRSRLEDFSVYRDATVGYRAEYGDERFYRQSFRQGFKQGYEDGLRDRRDDRYGRSGRYGSTVGDILGDIFGRRP